MKFQKLYLALIFSVMISCVHASTTNNTIDKIIHQYHMKPLPNGGGYYTETYRLCFSKKCKNTTHPDANAIVYLMTDKVVSRFHRVPSDEMFHYYSGDPVMLVQLERNGKVFENVLGSNVLHGQHIQLIVPKNTWQGAFLLGKGKYALMGATMTPGYYKEDMAKRSDLLKKYPEIKNIIIKLT